MNPILVYTPREAERNRFVCEKFRQKLGIVTVSPDYRGKADFVINRSNDYAIAKYYESMGIKVFNSCEFTRLANDKQLCYDFMEKNGIEILPTRYKKTPFVKKPRDSHGGNGVIMCYDKKEYDENSVCQKPADTLGRDLRCWIIGDEIITSILRTSDTDFRSNYCLGGNAVPYTLNDRETQLIKKIITLVKPFGAYYYGADFLFDNGKLIFNELEDTVGARMVYDKTDIDIIDLYIKQIITKLL